jgi:uncharacterized protein (TIGR02266 family)
MRNIAAVFRDFARLDLKRIGAGLTVTEFERWSRLKSVLDHEVGSRGRAPDERRSSPRVPTRLRCRYASCEELRDATVTNIATGGVFIATNEPAPVGTRLDLRIQIAESGAEIEVPAVVVSTNFAPGAIHKQGMGVRFSLVSPDMIEEISQLYAEQASLASKRSTAAEGSPAADADELARTGSD